MRENPAFTSVVFPTAKTGSVGSLWCHSSWWQTPQAKFSPCETSSGLPCFVTVHSFRTRPLVMSQRAQTRCFRIYPHFLCSVGQNKIKQSMFNFLVLTEPPCLLSDDGDDRKSLPGVGSSLWDHLVLFVIFVLGPNVWKVQQKQF